MQALTHVFGFVLLALASLVPGLGYWMSAQGANTPTGGDGEPVMRRTAAWAAGAGTSRVLELSNLNGRVVIVGEDRADVSVTARRVVERRGDPARPVPQVDVRQDGGRVLVCADEARCGCHVDGSRRPRRDGDDPVVRVDFEVRVPRSVSLEVCAVNATVVEVEGTSGPYTIRNVNGDLEVRQLGGHGELRTVNGDIGATFATPPDGATRVSSVNGDVDVTMPADLGADVRMRTGHGGLFTDFDTTPLPRRPVVPEQRGGRTIYRQDGHASVRVGRGGPELTFETLNGDVRLRRR